MQLGEKSITGILFLLIYVMLTSTVQARKSVYVISNTNGKEIQAYKVNGSSLAYQTTTYTVYISNVGLTIHESDYGKWLFCTFEGSDKIELIDAKSMVSDGEIDVPYASNLAGVVMDTGNSKLYAVDRYTNHLYSYSWDPSTKTLTPDFSDPYYVELEDIVISDGKGAFGIALDEENGLLYVGDNTTDIKYYDTSDWSKEGEVEVPCNVIGIAVDVANQLLYCGSMGGGYGEGDPNLYQYDISSQTEDYVTVGSSVAGIAVDQETALVYCTTYSDGPSSTDDRLYVYDINLTQHWVSNQLGSPAGVTVAKVGYKDPFYEIVKDDNEVDCVYPLISQEEHEFFSTPYNWLYYNIAWDANGYADNNVVVIDYLPKEVDEPNLISDGGVYDGNEHTVTWIIGDVAANDSDEFQIRVGVNNWARPGGVITNKVEIEGDEYLSWHIIDTNVCARGDEIIYVDEDANRFNNGTSWDDAYTDLRDAFTAAQNLGADITAIWVAAGTYKPTKSETDLDETFEMIEDLEIYGGFAGTETSTSQRNLADPNNETILTGDLDDNPATQGSANIITSNGLYSGLIDGFTITEGWTSGISCNFSYITIKNCKIISNTDGIYIYNSAGPYIKNCTIEDNYGCSVKCDNCWPTINNCNIDGKNRASYGLYCTGADVVMNNCAITSHNYDGIYASQSYIEAYNSFVKNNSQRGIYCSDSTLIINNGMIEQNNDEGIKAIYYSTPEITNSVIRFNSDNGIYCSQTLNAQIKNNWIHNNGADGYGTADSGIYLTNQGSSADIKNNTVVNNLNYGIYLYSGADPNISNCILFDNGSSASDNLYNTYGSFIYVTYCCVQGGYSGQGNINDDPCFVDADANNYHLDVNSFCIDAGDPAFNPDPSETDIDDEPRIVNGRVDIGADEYYWSSADFNKDEIVNFIDYAMFANAWQSSTGQPDYNVLFDLEDDNTIDYDDLALFCDDWLWQAGWNRTLEEMTIGMGMGGGMSQSIIESASLTEAVYSPVEVEQQQPEQINQLDIEEMLKWLAEVWLDPEVQETIDEAEWLKFIESLKSEFE